MKKSGIYGLRNVVTGKWYVGQSIDVIRRHHGHRHALRNGRHNNHRIVSDYNAHGWESFEFHLIEECPETLLDARERAWIEFYCSCDPMKGYNLDSGGSFYKKHSAETRAKIAAARRGKPHPHTGHPMTERTKQRLRETRKPASDEKRKRHSEMMKGRPFSAEHRKNLSIANMGRPSPLKGKKMSVETRRKISLAHFNHHKNLILTGQKPPAKRIRKNRSRLDELPF